MTTDIHEKVQSFDTSIVLEEVEKPDLLSRETFPLGSLSLSRESGYIL